MIGLPVSPFTYAHGYSRSLDKCNAEKMTFISITSKSPMNSIPEDSEMLTVTPGKVVKRNNLWNANSNEQYSRKWKFYIPVDYNSILEFQSDFLLYIQYGLCFFQNFGLIYNLCMRVFLSDFYSSIFANCGEAFNQEYFN